MKKLLLLLLVPATAFASVLTFTVPTLREDNTPLLYKDIGTFHAYCGSTSGVYTLTTNVPKEGTKPIQTFNLNMVNTVQGRTNYCVMTTLDKAGRESVYSNMVTIKSLYPPTQLELL